MLPEKPITRREMYLDYIARNGTIGGGITIDEEPTQGSYHATGSGGLYDALESLREDIAALRVEVDGKVYGVAGVGQEASALTRTHDAVGMVAQVGTDGDNSGVRNDFDNAGPWMRRKCVGRWVDGGDRARFVVSAYLGDPWYTEDGSIGDYVAVECPRCYYRFNHETGALDITATPMQGFRAFDIFCHNHNQAETIPVYYAPAYALAVKDGKAVSLPGLDDLQGTYQVLVGGCKTYAGDASDFAMLSPIAWFFYQWALFTVEFATQNSQSVMAGCTNIKSSDNDYCHFEDDTHLVVGYHAGRILGQYVAISSYASQTNQDTYATHKIVSIQRCNAQGVISDTGSYNLLELQKLPGVATTYEINTTYYYAGRPYRTGDTNTVLTPSGSLVSNSSGYYPCKYRWVENPWGNHTKTCSDLFGIRRGDANAYYLDWYLCLKPNEYDGTDSEYPTTTDLESALFEKLLITLPNASYKSGSIKEIENDSKYPDIYIPSQTSGASATTYHCDYAYLVSDTNIRGCRFGGGLYHGTGAGAVYYNAQYAPSQRSSVWGGALFFAQ